MEFHYLSEVRQKIGQTVVSRIGMILVLHALFQQLLMKISRAHFEPVVVSLAAIEIDGKLAEASVLLCQNERTVLVPVARINRISKDCC